MKRLSLLSLCFFLAACGGSSEVVCNQEYWDGIVGTCIPEGWDTISQEVLRQRGVPEETIVAFQKSESVSGQFPTVAITQERLPNLVKPDDYSQASIRSIEVMEGYEMLDTQDFDIAGEEVSLHIFTAQPIEGEPRRRFFQVSTTYEDSGFTITGVSPVSIDNDVEQQLMIILENVIFEAPTEEEN